MGSLTDWKFIGSETCEDSREMFGCDAGPSDPSPLEAVSQSHFGSPPQVEHQDRAPGQTFWERELEDRYESCVLRLEEQNLTRLKIREGLLAENLRSAVRQSVADLEERLDEKLKLQVQRVLVDASRELTLDGVVPTTPAGDFQHVAVACQALQLRVESVEQAGRELGSLFQEVVSGAFPRLRFSLGGDESRAQLPCAVQAAVKNGQVCDEHFAATGAKPLDVDRFPVKTSPSADSDGKLEDETAFADVKAIRWWIKTLEAGRQSAPTLEPACIEPHGSLKQVCRCIGTNSQVHWHESCLRHQCIADILC